MYMGMSGAGSTHVWSWFHACLELVPRMSGAGSMHVWSWFHACLELVPRMSGNHACLELVPHMCGPGSRCSVHEMNVLVCSGDPAVAGDLRL